MPGDSDPENGWKTSSSYATLDDMRKEESTEIESTETEKNLQDLRAEIDDIDLKVAALLDRRLCLSIEIGERKKVLGIQVHDGRREQFVLDRVSSQGRDASSSGFIRDVYDSILQGSRAVQSNLSKE